MYNVLVLIGHNVTEIEQGMPAYSYSTNFDAGYDIKKPNKNHKLNKFKETLINLNTNIHF